MSWLKILKDEVDKTSQAAVARQLNLSRSTINLVLHDKYPGGTDAIEEKVMLEFENKQVNCPVFGSISLKACRVNQSKKFNCNNQNSARLFRACRKCEHKVRVEIC